jgi:succinoglycan biosynthesis protein ExoM
MSDGTRRIDICICTFQRPYVVNTLASVAALLPVDGFSIHVIVADNDESPSAQVLVREAAEQFGLTLTYVHAPARA